MEIGVIVPAIRLGGIETFLQRLAGFLRKQGEKVCFLETEWEGEWASHFREMGQVVIEVPLRPWVSRLHHAKLLAKKLSKFDVVLLNDAPLARAAAGLVSNSTRIIAIVNTDLESQYASALGTTRNFDKVVAVSPAIERKLIQEKGIESQSVVQINYGIEIPDAWPREHPERSSNLRVTYLGRLSNWHKGIFLLPKIMEEVIRSELDVHLTIAGDGPDRIKLIQLITKRGLSTNIRLVGALQIDEVQVLLSKTDVLLLPSNFEGFPIAPLEAMAAGAVPILTRLEGSTDLTVEDGVSGVLVEKGNISGYANAIKSFAQNRGLLHKMSYAAWKRVKANFSVEAMGYSYMKLIKEVTKYESTKLRSEVLDMSLLGDMPWMPSGMVRPARKALRLMHLWIKPST